MVKIRSISPAVALCVLWLMAGERCWAQEFFPGNIFELRPPHVRVSEGTESAAHPRGGQAFDFFEPPPAIPPQSEVRLTKEDNLSLVYPASAGSFFSGGSALLDRLKVNGNELQLDLFQFTNALGPFGNALVPPSENSHFIGRLSAGEYTVTIHNWYLSWDMLLGFDPEAFVPPPDAVEASSIIDQTSAGTTIFDGSLIFSDPPSQVPIYSESSFQFTVLAVPEPSSFTLAAMLMLYAIVCLRIRSSSHSQGDHQTSLPAP